MVELLSEAKRRLIAEQGMVTEADFNREWEAAWALMVAEKAWPHATEHRRQWREAMRSTRADYGAAFLGVETPYSRWHEQALSGEPMMRLQDFGDTLVGRAVA